MQGPDPDALWARYARTVKRLRKSPRTKSRKETRARHASARASFPEEPATISAVPVPSRDRCLPPQSAPRTDTAFDRKTERILRDGTMRIDARLDLHGLTQSQAHEALSRFLSAEIGHGSRILLIVTGKGKGCEGVLRARLPSWLETLPAAGMVRALRPAALRHGGDGAFYVLLKRRKGASRSARQSGPCPRGPQADRR